MERCIKHFLSLVSEQARLHEDLIQLSARYNHSKRENLGGRMPAEDYGTERNKMSAAMIDYISNLEAEDLKPGTIDNSLEMDWEKLEREGRTKLAELLVEKINRLREALIFEDNPTRQMKYERDIAESEAQLRAIREQR
jgi:hypothetical protein